MSVGLGVDIVEIDRMRAVLERTPAFERRAFTPDEQAYCNAKANPATHFAARFAAKEAVCKALGTGILAHGVRMTDVEVVRDSRGKPAVALHGRAAEIAREQGVLDVPLSLTYTHNVAVANAVAITEQSQKEREKRRDVKSELAQQFRNVRCVLDDLGSQTVRDVEAAASASSDDSVGGAFEPSFLRPGSKSGGPGEPVL
ncbi:MAG: holo-ACP synthase [Slackia sp.]|nr:holo-ACP synthase [Slackia sp.]